MLPVFVAVKAGILPLPVAARPMPALLFAQLYVLAVPVKFTAVVVAPLQSVWLVIGFTTGVAFTLPVVVTNLEVAPVLANVILPDIASAAAVAADRI